MALPKLYDRIIFHNDTEPALNEDNLNAMSKGLDDVDDRLIDLAGTIMEDVPQIIEDMAILEPAIESIDENVAAAAADKLEAEGFAVGEQNGVPVDSSSPYYHNNAKYYSQVAPPTAAAHVSYDHSQSHLAATNVQGAVDELKEALTDEVETRSAMGAKNLLLNGVSSQTYANVTITKESDGSLSFSGTASGNIYLRLHRDESADDYILTPGEKYTISGFPSSFNPSNAYLYCEMNSSTVAGATDTGNGSTFTAPAFNTKFDTYIYFKSGTVIPAGTKVKPMIRLATDSDTTYQPYAMTNKELTNNKADKKDLASISITGTTNNTGATIAIGTYFYLNGALVKAKTSISNGATLTKNTNYVEVTVGALNDFNNTLITTGLSFNKCTLVGGGYCKVGSLVALNMKLTTTEAVNAWENIVTGLPTAPSGAPGGWPLSSRVANVDVYGSAMRATQSIISGETIPIAGTYLCVD